MAELTVLHQGKTTVIQFEGNPLLGDILAEAGFRIPRPCGGRGICGKCAVEVSGSVSAPDPEEQAMGVRLACRTVLMGDAEVTLPEERTGEQIQTDGSAAAKELIPMRGRYGAAVDIGTTTIALKLFDLQTGELLGDAAMLNPQGSTAADVMGRIGAAMNGQLQKLQKDVVDAIGQLRNTACKKADITPDQVDSMVVTGNTTMLYLLCGRDPSSLSRAPFLADTLFDITIDLLGAETYLPPCMNAFVGADITCAVLASEMCDGGETTLLCDIGTNGEIALWKDDKLYTTSTAAGPAFEGAGISCGCGSARGAIDKVWVENGEIKAHTIGEAPAVGICGSGLIDAIAAFLELELVDETGASEEDELALRDGIFLQPKDVRAVQLAKAAIAAGIETALESAGVSFEEVSVFYIAGGFGSHLNVDSAVAIGLIPPALKDKVKIIGNAALAGTVQQLLHTPSVGRSQEIAKSSCHVDLGGNPRFNERYMERMFFETDDF